MKLLFMLERRDTVIGHPENQDWVEQLVESERRAWKINEIPAPPNELLELVESFGRWPALRSTFDPHYMPPIELKTYSRFFNIGKKGGRKAIARLASQMSPFNGGWLLIDKSQRPDYEMGVQMHKGDSFIGLMTRDLRLEGKIATSEDYTHVPLYSRFVISYDEISKFVIPKFATSSGIKEEQAGVPKAIEYYALGNLFYKEWFGKTRDTNRYTWEWFEDKIGTDYNRHSSLAASDSYALDYINALRSDMRSDRGSFRLVIRFPSKT